MPQDKLFSVDTEELNVLLTLIGDFGHFHETDSVIVEFFRAVNLTLHEDKTRARRIMKYTPNFPKWDPETNLTTCIFHLQNNTYEPSDSVAKACAAILETEEDRLIAEKKIYALETEEKGKYMVEDFAIIEVEFKKFIDKFTEHVNGELSEFDKHHELLTRVKNAIDADDYEYNKRKANALLDDFIHRNKYKVAHVKHPQLPQPKA